MIEGPEMEGTGGVRLRGGARCAMCNKSARERRRREERGDEAGNREMGVEKSGFE